MITYNPGGINTKIAQALGLDPRTTTNMVISCEGRRAVSVTVCMLVTDEQGEKLAHVFKEYAVVPKEVTP